MTRRYDEPIQREDVTPPNGNGHGAPIHTDLSDLSDRQLIEETARSATWSQELAGRAARAAERGIELGSNAWSAIKGVERELRQLRASVSSVEVGLLEAIGRLSHETKARGELQAQIDDARRRADLANERAEVTGQHSLLELQRAMRESSQREDALTEAARASIAVAHAAEALAKQREERPRSSDSSDIGKKLANIVVQEKQADLTLRSERRRIAIKVVEVALVGIVASIITWIFSHH